MAKQVRRVLIILLAVVFAVSVAGLIWRTLEYRAAEETYAEAESLVNLPDLSELEPLTPAPTPSREQDEAPQESAPAEETPVYVDPYADALRNMDFTALREVNDDVLGWIVIPGTVLSYPLLQGSDNDYYLNHTWRGTRSAVGAIFLEYQNSSDLSDFNTIVYGHRMRNGSMFASLKYYESQSYWAQHPCVYITDDRGSYTYEIFAAYEVSTEGETYRLGFSSDTAKQAFLDYCVAQSVIDTGITPTIYDKILTLSTCTGNGHATRWVVQARLRGEAPAEEQTAPEEAPQETDPADPLPEETAPQASSTPEETGETGETASPDSPPPEPTDSAVQESPAAPAAENETADGGEPVPSAATEPEASGQIE